MQAEWFAGRLRELREEKGFGREQLAELAGIKASAVRDIEQGVYSPNWETVVALCRALGVTADAFLQGPTERPPIARGRPRKEPPTVPASQPIAAKRPGKPRRKKVE
jgi:transcriptional regulator with XRE-family HTH domain